MKKLLVAYTICVLNNLCICAGKQITIAILPPQNLSGGSNVDHWHYSIPLLFKYQLVKEKRVRLLPEESIDFAFRELKLNPDAALNVAEVRKLGEEIEAREVLWGTYQQEGGKCHLRMQLLDVESGEISGPLNASSAGWFQAVSDIRKGILKQLRIACTTEEERQMNLPLTSVPESLECLSRAYASVEQGILESNIVFNLQRAISLDPRFALAQQALAQYFFLHGETNEALNLARKAVENRPDFASTHSTLGTVYVFENSIDSAEKEFLEAIRLEPDNVDSYRRLAEVYFRQHKWSEAVSCLTNAESLSPYDPVIHAQLGYAYPYLSERDKAITELKIAERYNTSTNAGIEESLARAYRLLNETPEAVEHYEKFVAEAKKEGLQSSLFEQDESNLDYLKKTLIPTFVTASIPKYCAPEELENILHQRLTSNEYKLITNPFTSTPEIDKWADRLAGNTADDMKKARRLFYGLTRHINMRQEVGGRTAVETFKAWSNPKAGITCEDYTFLYIAMARHLGLQTYFVAVTKDYSGRSVWHACAGVVINGKCLLVDPAYLWFGVPHKDFKFLSDMEVIGNYNLYFLPDDKKLSLGSKLFPDWAAPHFWIAVNEIYHGHLKEAHVSLQQGLKLDSSSWLAFYAQSVVESADGDWKAVTLHLKRCLDLNPDYPGLHYLFGIALQTQGKLREARDEYRTYLQLDAGAKYAEQARKSILFIDKKLDSTGNP